MRKTATWRALLITTTIAVAGQLLSAVSIAQNYRFGVEEMELQVFVQQDASVRLEYKLVFNNAGDPIDVVDIGLPHRDYDISNMSASVDGTPVRDIRTSEYIDIGVEVHLQAKSIPRGGQGTFRFTCTMPDMVYKDTTAGDYASLQLRPTWFDPQLQMGRTRLNIIVHLPAGVRADEVKWQSDDLPYDELAVVGEGDDRHLLAWWKFPAHELSENNPKVGISFPRRVMQRVVTINAFQLLVKWFAESPGAQITSGLLLTAAFGFLFFRFSGGTGIVVFLILVGVAGLFLFSRPAWHLVSWPIMLGLIALNEWARARRGRKYLPAMATVEGGGIKRGLTAPQAALLLELPLGKVLTLVLLGLMKKGIVRQTAADPLTVEINEPFRVSRKKRRRAAAEQGIVLHGYEQPFLDRLIGWDKPVAQRELSKPIGNMIRALAGQMKGFDLSDTQEYYRRIVNRAWKEAESIGEIQRRDETVDRNFDWMVLDPDCSGRFDSWGHGGYYYRPSWTGSSGSSAAPSSSGPARGASSTSQTSFSEVAASFAGWTENTSASLASAIEPAGMGLDTPGAALLDLSGFDKVTADVLESLAESSGGGGGGGGGCACACAGCACACACAGGGR